MSTSTSTLPSPTNGTVNKFTMTNNASIAFDRNENFISCRRATSASNTAGVLDLSRFNFSGTTPTYTGLYLDLFLGPDPTSAAHSGTSDAVATATPAVDSNLPSFTDPTTNTTVTDKFSGNIYVAWGEEDSNTYGGIDGFNPFTIRMTSSSNQGVNFTHDAYVDNSSNANGYQPAGFPLHGSSARYTAPQIAISQGNVAGTVTPGQVTIVYDDYGTQAPIDRILDQTDVMGGTSEQFSRGLVARRPHHLARRPRSMARP